MRARYPVFSLHPDRSVNSTDRFQRQNPHPPGRWASASGGDRTADIEAICHLYVGFTNETGTDDHPALSKVFKSEEFGYQTITVERPCNCGSNPPSTPSKRFTNTENLAPHPLSIGLAHQPFPFLR